MPDESTDLLKKALDHINGRTELDDLATASTESIINGMSTQNFRLVNAEVEKQMNAKRLKLLREGGGTGSAASAGGTDAGTSGGTGDSAGGFEVVKEADFLVTNYYPPVDKNGKIYYDPMEGGSSTASGCKLVYDKSSPMGYYGMYKGKRYDYVCAVPNGTLQGGADGPTLPFVKGEPRYAVVFHDPAVTFIAFDHFAKSPWRGKYQKPNALDICASHDKWKEFFTAAGKAGLLKGHESSGYSSGVPKYHGKVVDLSKPISSGVSGGNSSAGTAGSVNRKLDVFYYNQFRDPNGKTWKHLGHVGCGITSLAITARFITGDSKITPDWCYEYKGNGIYYRTSTLNSIIKSTGVVYSDYMSGGEKAIQYAEDCIKKGYPCILHVTPPYAHSSHLMVVVGFDNKGDVYVHDPNNSNPLWHILNGKKGPYGLADRKDISKHITHINYVSKCPPSKSSSSTKPPSHNIPI